MTTRVLTTLRRYHRCVTWTAPLWALAAGLALDAVWVGSGWPTQVRLASIGFCALTAVMIRLLYRPSLRDTARKLDARMADQNRLEAVAEMEERDDALARALVAETDDHFSGRTFPWPTAMVVASALVVPLLVLCALNLGIGGLPPAVPGIGIPASAISGEQKPDAAPPPPAAVPEVSLRWTSPEPETQIPPGAALPLEAEAESRTGLAELVLNAIVDAEPIPPIPLPTELAPGRQRLPLALPLDVMAIRRNDWVGYFLTAERMRPASATGKAWPSVSSTLQLVWVVPPEDDLPIGAGNEELEAAYRNVQQLRHDQATRVTEIFALRHELVPESTQAEFAATLTINEQAAHDAIGAIPSKGLPNAVSDDLDGAKAELATAIQALGAPRGLNAMTPAWRALVRLSAAERGLREEVASARVRRAQAEAQATTDPETVRGKSELPPREATPAGQAESLARQQAILAERLAARDTTVQEAFEAEDRIARSVAKLVAAKKLPREVNRALETAAAAAREAANQLNEQDLVAAIEPAARSAQSLGEAVAKMDEMGRAQAAEDLLAAQRSLIHLATDLAVARPADLTDALSLAEQEARATEEQLQAAARNEQQTGSEAAAKQLRKTAEAVHAEAGDHGENDGGKKSPEQAGAGAAQQDGGGQGASAAGQSGSQSGATGADQAGGSPSTSGQGLANRTQQKGAGERQATHKASTREESGETALSKRSEERQKKLLAAAQAAANASKAADGGKKSLEKAAAEAKAAQQKAGEQGASATKVRQAYEEATAASQSATQTGAKNTRQAYGPPPPPGPGLANRNERIAYAQLISAKVEGLVQAIDQEVQAAKRRHVLTTANPTEAPPAYRSAVETYFETLARASAPTGPKSAAPKPDAGGSVSSPP